MIQNVYHTENNSTWNSIINENDINETVNNKPIISLVIFALTTISPLNISDVNSNFHQTFKKTEQSENRLITFTTNEIEQESFDTKKTDEIYSINNNILEVDDLADHVTQSQIDEIKAHFNTQINLAKTETLSEMKEYVSEETEKVIQKIEDIEKKKEEKKSSFTSNFTAPIITGIIVVVLTNITNIISFISELLR